MRAALTLMIVLGISAGARAQTIGLPMPSMGLPLPEMGLPLPSTGLPPIENKIAAPGERLTPSVGPQSPRDASAPGRAPAIVYFLPVYGWPGIAAPLSGPPPVHAAPPAPPPAGHLSVDVQRGVNPQIFIDGAFVATLDDVLGELTLDPGVHRLELRADGYDTRIVDVQIAADRTTRYRTTLDGGSASRDRTLGGIRPTPDSAPPAAPVAPSTIYMIPGCYVGNVPPRQVALPAGCDPDRVAVFPPSR